jgi:hypothetical protein
MKRIKTKDRKEKIGAEQRDGSSRVGLLGGGSGSSSEPMMISGNGTSRPAAPLDVGGTKIPRNADPAPPQAPSYKDLVGKLKSQKAPEIGPVTPSRPRERSPPRGDRRPLEAQRRRQKDFSSLFPGGDEREEALARRNKTIPKADTIPKATQRFDISDKRKAETDIYRRNKRPNPAAEKFPTRKRKAVGPPDSEYEQDLRKPPPKPEERRTARNRIKPESKPKPKPDTSRNKTRNKKK